MHRRRSAALASLVVAAMATCVYQPAVGAGLPPTGAIDTTFGTGGDGTSTVDLSRPSIDVAYAALHANSFSLVVGSANDDFAIANTGYPSSGSDRNQTIPFDERSVAFGIAAVPNVGLVTVGRVGDDFGVVFDVPGVDIGDLGRIRTSLGRPAVARGVAGDYERVRVAGTVGSGPDADLAIVGYGPRGELDPTFGAAGILVVDLSGGEDAANAIDMEVIEGFADRPVVAGRAGGAALVARLQPDGSSDPTFGIGGRAFLDLTPADDVAHALHVLPDGRSLIAGTAGGDSFVARLTAVGTLDPSFGTNGVVIVDLGPGGGLKAVTDGGSGSVVAGGTIGGPSGKDAVVVRLTPDGTFDSGFGVGGQAVVDFGGPADSGNALLGTGPSPTIVGGDGLDMRIARLDSAGRLQNPTESQRAVIDFSSSSDKAMATAVQPDGKILVVGTSSRGLMLLRFRADGTLDPGFGQGGVVIERRGSGSSVAVQPDGKILVGGFRGVGAAGTGVFRFLPDGRHDDEFGSTGFIRQGGERAVAVDAEGRIYTADQGIAVSSPEGELLSSVSLHPDQFVTSLAVHPDGGVLAAVRYLWHEGGSLLRFRPGDTGLRGTEGALGFTPRTLEALPDGRTVAAGAIVNEGIVGGPLVTADAAISVVNRDGTVDQTFGGRAAVRGVVRLDLAKYDFIHDVARTPDGKLLVLFAYGASATNPRFGVARLHSDGRPDRSFGARGVWISTVDLLPSGIALGPGGRIVAAGTRFAEDYDVTLVGVSPTPATTGPARAWGFGALGQLAVGSGPAKAVAAGTHHTLAVAADGTVTAAGWNLTGQLGDGSTADRHAPVPVAGLTGVVAVAAGTYHSLALKSDGTVWAWGWNHFGQLGTGSRIDHRTPAPVPGLTQIVAIAAGAHHSLALRSDGTAWAWGWNGVGQVGTGTTADSAVPVRVSVPAGVTDVAAGSYHSLFLYETGTIAVAGWNAFGQLGTGAEYRLAPAFVFLSGTWQGRYVAIAGGGLHSVAVRDDGTVWAWGWNHFGELGNGTTASSAIPVQVDGISNAESVAGGAYHSLVRGRDGVVKGWGWNGYGQLGTGTTADSAVPVTASVVPPGAVVTGIAAGALHSVAY